MIKKNKSIVSVFLMVVFMWGALLLQISYAKGGNQSDPEPGRDAALAFLQAQMGASGLLDSYVDDNIDYAYTYDNALAIMAFVSSGDIDTAKVILDALASVGPEPEGGFLNRYLADSGAPDGTLELGPNGYVIQAINLYYEATNDDTYNGIAVQIAQYMLSLQDENGGLFGNASVTWKSTENNLGALSGIHNLGIIQNNSYYIDRASAIRSFLVDLCWDGERFLRGEDDYSIATDTQSLGNLVLGTPYKNGIYWVRDYTMNTRRYSGRLQMTGFDMNDDKDTIWTEGTLQQALSYLYAGDTNEYSFFVTESEKLFQESGALLLATNSGTTGFGWILEPWEAVAPTAWYIFALNQDNVLELY